MVETHRGFSILSILHQHPLERRQYSDTSVQLQWFPGKVSGQWATVRPAGQKYVERFILALQSSVSKWSETMSIHIYNLMNHWPRTQSRRVYSTKTAFFVWCAEVVRHKWQALILHKGSSSDMNLSSTYFFPLWNKHK